MDVDRQEVLKVVLECVPDAATLLACSMLSTTCQCMVQQALQGRSARLAELVTGSSSTCAIQWLCGLAGPAAVNSYPAGCALLDKVMQMPQDVAPLMLATGLRLTNQLLMYMAKQGMCNMPHVVRNILDCGVPSSADAIYVSAASGDIMDTMQDAVRLAITADNIGDLLTIRSQVCVWDDDAVPAVLTMLRLKEWRLHTLHVDSAMASASTEAAAATSASSGSISSSAGPALHTSQDAVSLMMQLLRACHGTYAVPLFEQLLMLPAARNIGTMDALRLLHQAAADACHWHGMTSRPPHETLEELDGLAQAADVPPKWVAELTAHCIANRQYAQAGVLLQIPSAEQMDCGQLCKLVGMAHGGGRHAARLYNSLASALGRLIERRPLRTTQLRRAELLQLCDAAVEINLEYKVEGLVMRLRRLRDLTRNVLPEQQQQALLVPATAAQGALRHGGALCPPSDRRAPCN